MKRKTRYLFIVLGLALFLVLGPLIVLYVTGIRYNFYNDQYEKTGIISIKTDPAKADVFLDGEKLDTSPVNIRFLKPKEYTITLKKEGYFDWNKRIDIKEGKATILAGALDKIFMIKRDQQATTLGQGVTYYILTDEYLAYMANANLVLGRGENFAKQVQYDIPVGVDRLVADNRSNYIVIYGADKKLLFDVGEEKLTDISKPLSDARLITPTADGLVLFTDGNNKLHSYNSADERVNLLADNVRTFNLADGLLYYLQTDDQNTTSLIAAALDNKSINSPQTLLSGIPELIDPRLFITENKDIALWDNDRLFRVNKTLEPIASEVNQVFFDPRDRTLGYTTPGQFQQYSFNSNSSSLVTRQSSSIVSPLILDAIGYAFYISENKVQAIELDARDKQNQYQLGEFGQPFQMTAASDYRYLLFLEDTSLKQITIR